MASQTLKSASGADVEPSSSYTEDEEFQGTPGLACSFILLRYRLQSKIIFLVWSCGLTKAKLNDGDKCVAECLGDNGCRETVDSRGL